MKIISMAMILRVRQSGLFILSNQVSELQIYFYLGVTSSDLKWLM